MTEQEISRQKRKEFTARIIGAVSDLIDGVDGEPPAIPRQHLLEYTTEFMYALGTLAPTVVYANLIDENVSNQQFNYDQNGLIIQFALMDK